MKIARAHSYGGVLFDDDGRLLLRKPRNEFDGYVWTFAKGRPDPDETPAETARREVRQETGYEVEITGVVPGTFQGGTGTTGFFLMAPKGRPHPFDTETEATIWVHAAEAAERIRETRNPIGRRRDLSVLHAALEARRALASGAEEG